MTAQNKFINNNIADNSHLVALQELIDVVAKLRSLKVDVHGIWHKPQAA